MPFSLFDGPEREPSQFVGFAGNVLDRQAENRTEDCVERALADPRARVLAIDGSRIVMPIAGDRAEAYLSPLQAEQLGGHREEMVLLGWDEQGPALAVSVTASAEQAPEGFAVSEQRAAYVKGLLDPAALGAMAQGASLLTWNRTHRFCGRCGSQTELRIGGYKRSCTGCGAEHFPRTDPVAIMLAVRDDRCLLGRSPHFAPGMFSALAGFIEPGETIENAVRREVLEESGIRVGRVAYHASQPWPFPHSLMIGCYGEALNKDIRFDGNELDDCRWFTREAVLAMAADAHPEGLTMPPAGSIARHLIANWAEAPAT